MYTRPPGGGNGTPPQYSCLGHPMDRGAWRATVLGVTKSWTRLDLAAEHTRVADSGPRTLRALCSVAALGEMRAGVGWGSRGCEQAQL